MHGCRNVKPPSPVLSQRPSRLSSRATEYSTSTPLEDRLLLCPNQHEDLDRALLCLSPRTSASTYLTLLRACCESKSLLHVRRVHAYMSLHGYHLIDMLGDYLVMSLAKCGGVDDAWALALAFPHLTVFSWTSLIHAFADSGLATEALVLHQHMLTHGLEPDSFTFVAVLKACSTICDLTRGFRLHAHARAKGFDSNPYVGNALMTMYFFLGAFKEACDAFDGLSYRSTVSWNKVISELVEHGHEKKSLLFYKQMREEGVDPDAFTYVNLLKACGVVSDLDQGKRLHSQVLHNGSFSNIFVGNTVLNMYRKCREAYEAENAFIDLSARDMVSWNGLMSAYVDDGQLMNALRLYRQMHEECIHPDQATFVIVFQACMLNGKDVGCIDSSLNSIEVSRMEIGRALHADVRRGNYCSDVLVGTAILSMYNTFKMIQEAESVFSKMALRDTPAWNAMISAYVDQGLAEKALQLYREMQCQGSAPNHITFMMALQASRILAGKEGTSVNGISYKAICLEIGRALHADISRGNYASDSSIVNTLVSMYGNCGSIIEAEIVFSKHPCHETVSGNSMLSAYVETGQEGKAIHLYRKMQEDSVNVDDITHLCALQACCQTGSIAICMELHFNIVMAGHDKLFSVASTLLTAYGSSAGMEDAYEVFTNMSELDVVLFNALFSGYAGEGNSVASERTFNNMRLMGTSPDAVTFISILSVFSHAGLVVEGLKCLNSLQEYHGVVVERTHHKILIDLLGRAGDFKRIENMFLQIPVPEDPAIWLCLLGTCSTRGNFTLAKQAFDHVMLLKPQEARAYVLMSNVYIDDIW